MKALRTVAVIIVAGVLAVSVAACNGSGTNTSQSQDTSQRETQQVAKKLNVGHNYPLSQMNGSTEVDMVRERLLRFNNPDKLGYVYLLTANGQILAYYAIKGKVSSTGSQILNTQDTTKCDGNSNSGCSVVDSVGDDGTYGPEECSTTGSGTSQGIFFFTTSSVMVETCDPYWVYSDAPLHLSQPPLLTLPLSSAPSSTAGQLRK